MAEALLRHLSKGRADVDSAGSSPQPAVHPLARSTLEQRYGIDTADLRPKSMREFLGERFDFIISITTLSSATALRRHDSEPVIPYCLKVDTADRDVAASQISS
jgi:protein-tyrosine-phosphatase